MLNGRCQSQRGLTLLGHLSMAAARRLATAAGRAGGQPAPLGGPPTQLLAFCPCELDAESNEMQEAAEEPLCTLLSQRPSLYCCMTGC